MLGQQIQQGELGAGQLQRLAVEARFLTTWVQAQGVHFQGRRAVVGILLLLAPVGTAQDRANTGHQFTVVERFR
ncbi:hypothetical protein D3C85_1860720 [compost metagenome]